VPQTRSAGEAQTPGEGADHQDQTQQTIAAASIPSDASALRTYVGQLRKAIQSRVVYPPQARLAGQVGTPVVRFTVSLNGDILPGSLAIQRSSGYPLLDENALQAARDSSPLPPPPRQFSVAIAVAFAREP
jgi:periplasmic protein TonB